MSIQIQKFQVTVPPSTPILTPYTQQLQLPQLTVAEIDIKVPPGPRGQVGFAIGAAGQPVIPFGQGTWIVTDDEEIRWPLDNFWDSGSWEVFAYNLGQYPHTLYLVFLLQPLAAANSSIPGGLVVATDLAGILPAATDTTALTPPASS